MSADAPAADESVGRTGEPFEFIVEKGKIREFARATLTTNPAYFDGDNPLTEPTFLMVAAHWQNERSGVRNGLRRDFTNVLHGGQEFVFHGEPPRAGTVLTGQQRLDKVYSKEGKRGGTMRFLELVTEFRDAGGALVAEARATIIETGKTPPKES